MSRCCDYIVVWHSQILTVHSHVDEFLPYSTLRSMARLTIYYSTYRTLLRDKTRRPDTFSRDDGRGERQLNMMKGTEGGVLT